MCILTWLAGCTGAGSQGGGSDCDDCAFGGTTTFDEAPPGGLRIVTGIDAVEIARADGPGQRCGADPPVILGDVTADGVPEIVVTCLAPDSSESRNKEVHLLDGAALLAGTFTPVATLVAHTDAVTGLGDLDGDGLEELGFGERVLPLNGIDEIPWWSVRLGAEVVAGTPAALTLTGDGDEYGSGPPIPAGDVDLDGVPDLAVWQQPGSADPVLSLVSGAALLGAGPCRC